MSVSRYLTSRPVDSTDALVKEITVDTTRWALQLFNDFCYESDISFEFTSKNVPALVQVLKRLYVDERLKKYDKISTFHSLRFALKRHFLETLKVDIIKDEPFMEANKAFTAMENSIKAVILKQKFAPIQEKDMERLKKYFETNIQNPTPEQLLEYIWFILQYYKRQMGPCCYDTLNANRFIIRTDTDGKKYILPNEYEPLLSSWENRSTKKSFFSNLIPAMKDDVLCPVMAFKLYKSKIHKDLEKLFQTPKKHIDPQQECWFDRKYLSRSSLKEMMTTLSQNANLSTIYANQSLTGAAIAKMIWGENLGKDIQSNSKPSNWGEKTTTIRQVKMKSPMTIVKKKKLERPQNYETTSVNKNRVTELLNQEKSPLKTDSSVANPSPIINMTKGSQQHGVKLPPNKSVPSVSSVNNAPCTPVVVPSHLQALPPPKQPPSKSEMSPNVSNNNKKSEILTSIKTELCRHLQDRVEVSTVVRQNVWTPRTNKVVPDGYQETPSSVNVQNDENREPSSRSTFTITNVRSCDSPFTNRNVAETIVKPVETPTHSYVIHNHQSSMLANMAELWKKGKFCDATIGNGTMKIMVHKIVLLALSPQLVDSSNSDLTSECFQFNFPQEIGGDALWAFSKYMYEGVVSLNSDVLEDMEQISAILNLQDLKDTCNLYRNQVNLPIKTTRSSQLLATKHLTPADHTAINLNPLPASIKSEASQSVATIKSEASPNGVTIKSEASPNGTTIKSETSLSVVAIKSEASPSVVAIQSETSQIRAATKSETSPNVVATQSETSQIRAATKSETSSIRAAIKSEASQSEISVFSLPSGDVTETVSRPAQHLQIMMPESNNTRLNQSSIGGVNRATDDRTCVTISGSDSDSDLTLVSSNSKKNLVRKRRSRHIKNNFLQSRQPESFLNDNMRESWPPHSYNGNDNLTNPSQSKQMKLSDNLVIDHSQSFEISYAGSNQRSNNVPYSLIEDSDESS